MSAAPLAWTLVGVTVDELVRYLRARARARAAQQAAFVRSLDRLRADDVARENERAVLDGIDWSSPQARAGLDAIFDAIDALPADPPPLDLDVIDLRDSADGARWN